MMLAFKVEKRFSSRKIFQISQEVNLLLSRAGMARHHYWLNADCSPVNRPTQQAGTSEIKTFGSKDDVDDQKESPFFCRLILAEKKVSILSEKAFETG